MVSKKIVLVLLLLFIAAIVSAQPTVQVGVNLGERVSGVVTEFSCQIREDSRVPQYSFTNDCQPASTEYEYQWFINGATVIEATASTFNKAFEEPGTYTIQLRVTKGGTTVLSNILTVTIDAPAPVPEPEPEPEPTTNTDLDTAVDGEILTLGYVIFRVTAQKDGIEAVGLTMEQWANALAVKTKNGRLLAKGAASKASEKILLKVEGSEYYIVINNLSRSDKREIRYAIEWQPSGELADGYDAAVGGFTVEANDSEVKEGVCAAEQKINVTSGLCEDAVEVTE